MPTDPSLESVISMYEIRNMRNYKTDEIKKELAGTYKRVKDAFEKGVMIVNGSDMYLDFRMPQGAAAKQTLLAYLRSGLKPADVLRTAIYNASIALGKKDQIGVLKANANADLVVFDGDLEKDFSKVVFNVARVMKEGNWVK